VTDNLPYTFIPYKDKFIKLSRPKSARAIYKDKIIDLLSNVETNCEWSIWFDEFDFSIDKKFPEPRVTHFFYELGFIIEHQFEITDATLLAIDIEYQDYDYCNLSENISNIELSLTESIEFENYEQLFLKGRENLLLGNCYQFNLTCEHRYQWSQDYLPLNFIASIWKSNKSRGAFGSATYIPCWNYLYLSNSPECLFQLKGPLLSSLPIKGTLPLKSKNQFKVKWKELINDVKNESELFMIIDLLRNDLARIELPRAKVVSKKLPLIVPGLLHQYAHIEVELTKSVTIKRILEKMFPGGSVTGAPKKRVMKLLYELENRERKFYCGSTLLCFKNMKSASINIRTAGIDFSKKLLNYQSGGGITLKSTAKGEFQEMINKRESFIRAF
jgi:anthranilate/para-aminobenzoate synthase component I